MKRGIYYFSLHGDDEQENDNLTIAEVEEAILAARVLEEYKDTGRGQSCLVIGFTDDGKPIHMVCGSRRTWMVIITIYIPKPPKFKNPYERWEEE